MALQPFFFVLFCFLCVRSGFAQHNEVLHAMKTPCQVKGPSQGRLTQGYKREDKAVPQYKRRISWSFPAGGNGVAAG